MNYKTLMVTMMMTTLIVLSGCSTLQADEIYNFLTGHKNVLDYVTNCTMTTNISLDTLNCGLKRSIFVNYDNSSWNEMCCTFDSRCVATSNVNVSNVCSNVNATFTYIGPVFAPQTGLPGSMCCNGEAQCYMDTIPNSNCTNMNLTQTSTSIAFNLTNTTEWDAICCIGGY